MFNKILKMFYLKCGSDLRLTLILLRTTKVIRLSDIHYQSEKYQND